jgi:glycosyltransferase involved in cell wall biosynthesis
MMTRQGHEVILYAGKHNTAEVAELVQCHPVPKSTEFFVPPWTQEYFEPMNKRVIREMRKRIQPGDLILLSMGVVQLPIQEAFPENVSVEYCVGYGGATAPVRVFPSEAWRHIIYGHQAENVMVIRGMCTDAVIPHFLDVKEFPAGQGGGYLLFVGRLGSMKGEEVAVQTAERTGIPLKIVGSGPLPEGKYEYVGAVGPKERAELMGGALAVMAPSMFPEPFCLVAIEAQMCGTPVLTTDWGAFTETVEQGETGFRCSTMDEFVRAVSVCQQLDRRWVRERALSLYSTAFIGPQYTRFFKRLEAIYPTVY